MPRPPAFDTSLLGGLSVAAFLARHWQRKPLLIRAAIDGRPSLPTRDELFELARRDDVESRLVSAVAGRWSLAHGPFERTPRRRRDWTLLVQGVNLFDRRADALMRRFDFVSAMRLDDLMMSYAADGGGVGPHLDSYDVFLLQVEGRRRWRWRHRRSTTPREQSLVDGAPIRMLAHFEPTDEAILEPGDMLYLPPSCAHEGVALGECITASIGFRTPSWNALVQEFLFAMAEKSWPEGRHTDPGRAGTHTPAAIDPALFDAIGERIARIRFTPRDVETFVGRHFSEPKAQVFFDPPPRTGIASFARRAARCGLVCDPRTTMLYRGRRAWVAGEAFELPAATAAAFRRFADGRTLDPGAAGALLAAEPARALLHRWWQHGWILFDDGGPDDAR